MFGVTLKATNSSFQKDMKFCRSIYVKKVMKLLAFIFEQPSYLANCMHDLASNTELDSENHKMKVVLTPEFRHLSPKRNNIEPRKQALKF